MTSLSDRMLVTAFGLIDLGLATVSFGWQGAGWVRLCAAGRPVIEEGLAE
ncbi:hypothetical protein [Aureimonas psammosilenae]|nr:hypothetical protein [Aureimonas psammosilenae]